MDFKKFMAQAAKIQKEMEKQNAALEATEFKATAANGDVEVVLTGNYQVKSIQVKDELCTVDNKEILQDYLLLALNAGLKEINAQKDKGMENLTNSFSINSLL